ncbi:MAG: hypothetical protein NHB32_08455 [Fischerella sp. CENA71]|nr:hypothetical protein [Fischerella sp. CENA71]
MKYENLQEYYYNALMCREPLRELDMDEKIWLELFMKTETFEKIAANQQADEDTQLREPEYLKCLEFLKQNYPLLSEYDLSNIELMQTGYIALSDIVASNPRLANFIFENPQHFASLQ